MSQNLDCLQQATADQAFTNAKAAGDVEVRYRTANSPTSTSLISLGIQGMTNALIFRALERNTGKVGLASVLCTETAKNPEIAAISQHQDPASNNAAATNKAIVLELAKQIASIGGNPQDALKSGTFKPGDVNDATGKGGHRRWRLCTMVVLNSWVGNTCDDANDAQGCIFTQNLLVEDATAEEINAAVAGISSSSSGSDASASGAAATATASADCENGAYFLT